MGDQNKSAESEIERLKARVVELRGLLRKWWEFASGLPGDTEFTIADALNFCDAVAPTKEMHERGELNEEAPV